MAQITTDMLDAIKDTIAPTRPAGSADLTFTNGAKTAVYDLVNALRGVLDADDDTAARDVIDNYFEVADNYSDERVFTLYWLTGAVQTVTGPDISTAMNNAGYGAGALGALDFHAEGTPDPDYYWNSDKHSWRRKSWDADADVDAGDADDKDN